jgi:hypothetical protein
MSPFSCIRSILHRYTQTLARDGGRLLVALWGTRLLHPESMSTSMVSVQVPAATTAACAAVRSELCAPPYRVCVSGDGVLDAAHGGIACYWRLSAQVYQELSDWQTLGELTLQLLKKRDALVAPGRTGSEAL